MSSILSAPLALTFYFAGPITYVISAIATWQSGASVLVKLLMNITLDAILAALWPITWAIWIGDYMLNDAGPLTTVFGL